MKWRRVLLYTAVTTVTFMSGVSFAVVLDEPWLDHIHTPPSLDVEP